MNLNIDLICDNDQLRNALMTNYKTFYEYRITYTDSNPADKIVIIITSIMLPSPPHASWTIYFGLTNKNFYSYDNDTQSHMINTTNDKIEEAYKYILMCNIVNNKSPIIYSRHQLAQHPMCKLVQE